MRNRAVVGVDAEAGTALRHPVGFVGPHAGRSDSGRDQPVPPVCGLGPRHDHVDLDAGGLQPAHETAARQGDRGPFGGVLRNRALLRLELAWAFSIVGAWAYGIGVVVLSGFTRMKPDDA